MVTVSSVPGKLVSYVNVAGCTPTFQILSARWSSVLEPLPKYSVMLSPTGGSKRSCNEKSLDA
jgi:hypothetical protein